MKRLILVTTSLSFLFSFIFTSFLSAQPKDKSPYMDILAYFFPVQSNTESPYRDGFAYGVGFVLRLKTDDKFWIDAEKICKERIKSLKREIEVLMSMNSKEYIFKQGTFDAITKAKEMDIKDLEAELYLISQGRKW